jgi:hypothetical protein
VLWTISNKLVVFEGSRDRGAATGEEELNGDGEREGEGELNGYFVKCPFPLSPESLES